MSSTLKFHSVQVQREQAARAKLRWPWVAQVSLYVTGTWKSPPGVYKVETKSETKPQLLIILSWSHQIPCPLTTFTTELPLSPALFRLLWLFCLVPKILTQSFKRNSNDKNSWLFQLLHTSISILGFLLRKPIIDMISLLK